MSFLFFLPLVRAESPAPTQPPSDAAAAPAETTPSGHSEVAPAERPVEKNVPEKKLSFEAAFNLGIQSYQSKKYDEALRFFQTALDLHPDSSSVLTNLGLTVFQLHQKGLAIAYFRRALAVDPSDAAAGSGLKFAWSQLEVKEIPHQLETYEKFRDVFLNPFSMTSFHLLTALLLFSSGWIWLKYAGRRRRALEEEAALPGIPLAGSFLALLFVVALTSTLMKSYDLTVPRATVVVDKVSAQTAPGEGQNSLFDLYAGFEVILRNISTDWVQVTYPGGLTGWVKKDSVMATSGKSVFAP